MTKKQYFNLALVQDLKWLRYCAAHPGPYMKPTHVALIKLAIRYKTR